MKWKRKIYVRFKKLINVDNHNCNNCDDFDNFDFDVLLLDIHIFLKLLKICKLDNLSLLYYLASFNGVKSFKEICAI